VISVVVPVYDAMPWLVDQLAALAGQSCATEWEVVVADNGSTDDSPTIAREFATEHPAFRVVDASARRGPGAARNTGVGAARGDCIAFCDADDVVQEGWLEGLVAALDRAEVVAGAFDFRSLNGGGPAVPRPASTSQFGFLPGGLGANLAVRRAAFEEVGGFDEDLRVGEDIDLCWRLQLAGGRFAVASDAVVSKRDQPGPDGVFRHGLTYGRSVPVLYRRHRAAGARPDLAGALRSWVWLVLHLPQVARTGPARRQWVHAAGVRVGRLLGSIDQRVFFP
jgi:GT2 family glycosyltransferase